MTKHEAIEALEEIKMLDDSMFAYSQVYNDALDIAIEALKVQEARVDVKSQEIISGFTLYCPNCGFANRFENPRWWTTISPRENTVFYCGKCGMEVKWE